MMKKLLIVALCAFGVSTLAFGAVANAASADVAFTVLKKLGVTIEVARKAALVRVPGEVEDEWEDEDDDEKVIGFVFHIRKSDAKLFEVKVNSDSGKVTSAEEVDESEEEDPQ